MKLTPQNSDFDSLVREVKACRKCARMGASERVIGYGSGEPAGKTIMFVGEAPGRLGADDSLMPFHGDQSGHNFERLMEQVGLSRYDVFVTNAVLCNPKDENGNNATPTKAEISNCSSFLARQIEIVNPKVVATLGAVPLRSCALVAPHSLTLSGAVRTATGWNRRLLVPLYHPGQRAMIHRSFANQLADYQFLKEQASRSGQKRGRRHGSASSEVLSVVNQITSKKNGLSYFALHKLLFLAEVRHFEEHGERLTQAYVVRQKDGPYFVDLHPTKLANAGYLIGRSAQRLTVSRQLNLSEVGSESPLKVTALDALNKVMEKYSKLSESDLKRVVYLTRPMRAVLRMEKQCGVNMFNAPLLIQND